MAEKKNNFFSYKGLPLVRKGKQLYFGNMYDDYVVMIDILGTEKQGDLDIANKVRIIKLATDFTSYAALFSVALNSMASRFLMLERTRGNVTAVSQYFSSITLANVILSAILTVPSVICVVFLEKFLAIPDVLVVEVKLTFAVTFASFIANLYISTYSYCFYLTNKLSIGSIRDAIMNVLRIASIILLFSLTTPRISYVATGGLIATAFAVVFNYYYTKKLTPELRFRFRDF